MDGQGKYQRVGKDKCASLWFSRFKTGLKIRMGSDAQQNRGMSNKLILLMIERVEYKIEDADTKMTRNN